MLKNIRICRAVVFICAVKLIHFSITTNKGCEKFNANRFSIQWRIEGILDVLNRLMPWFAGDSDNIEAYVKTDAMVTDIGIGSLHNFSNLIVGDSIHGIAITVTSAGFHLYDGQRIILLRHDVKFLMSEPPVTVTYGVATCHEIGRSTILTDLSKFIMLCHNRIILR